MKRNKKSLKKKQAEIIKQAKKDKKHSSLLNSSVGRQIGRTVARELTRGILGVLGLGGKTRTRRRKKSSFSWF